MIRNNNKRYRLGKTKGIIKNFSDAEEEEIINWLTDCRNQNQAVSTKSLISYLLFASKNLGAKIKCAYRFIKRKGFAIRRISI